MRSRQLRGHVSLDEIVSPLQIQPSDLELRFNVDSGEELSLIATQLIQRTEKRLERSGLEKRFCPRSVVFHFPERDLQILSTELTLQQNPSLAI